MEMGPAGGRADTSVITERLFQESYRFEFFQAVRLLERFFPERKPLGQHGSPGEEVVRLRSHVSHSFPPSQIQDVIRVPDAKGIPEMTVAFMGLAGVQGVLPEHYTDEVLKRVREGDFALRDFLDLFNHRLLSYFYRAWEKYRFPIAYERAFHNKRAELEEQIKKLAPQEEGAAGSEKLGDKFDAVSLDIFHLFGMGPRGLRERTTIEGNALLFYSGLLAQQPRSASALVAVLKDYFKVPISIRQFIGQWLEIPLEQRSVLNSTHPVRLKTGPVLGARFWDQQASFRLRVGPLDLGSFLKFLPPSSRAQACGVLPERMGLKKLVHWVRLFVGQALDFEALLVLRKTEVPACIIGRNSDHPGHTPALLGQTTWLTRTQKGGLAHDAEDMVVKPRWTRL